MKKVLVAGAGGFVGFSLCKLLLSSGFKVIGIDNLNSFIYSARYKYNRLKTLGFQVDDLEKGNVISIENMEFHRLDLQDAPAIRALILDGRFDFIINAASLGSTSLCEKSPYVYIKNTTLGFLNIIDAIREINVDIRPVFMYLGDVMALNLADESGYNHNGYRYSTYTAGKAIERDLACTYSHVHNIEINAFNVSDIYGPHDRPDGYMYSLCNDVFNNEDTKQSDDTADLIFIDDVTAFMLEKIKSYEDSDKKANGSFKEYALCSGSVVSRRSMLQSVHKMIVSLDNDEKISTDSILYAKVDNCPEIDSLCGFKAQTSLIEGFEKALKWYLYKS